MQLTEEVREKLIARHHALMKLAKYLEGDTNDFISFLKNVFLFEKNLEQERDPGHAQCNLIAQILHNEQQLRKVIFTEEWQHVLEYFILPNNATELLDIFYQLELGNPSSTGRATQLRAKLIRDAFFQNKARSGMIAYSNTFLKFVFSPDQPRWNITQIDWDITEYQGTQRIVGEPVISLGFPNPDGPEIYRQLFGLLGSERKAAATLAIRGLTTDNQALQFIAREILEKLDWDLPSMQTWFTSTLSPLQESFVEWQKNALLEREFSSNGIQFITDALYYFERTNPEIHAKLKARLENLGFLLAEVEKPSGYDFSNQIAKGSIIRSKPMIKYYWPEDDNWCVFYPGKCNFSAGPVPMFLQELERLAKESVLQPRFEDIEIVKDLLLYIQLGDKVPKPPILPVYNALRRWLEALGQKQDYRNLENFCSYAKIFRPHLHIPAVGEKPTSIASREHKLIPKLAPEQKPGIIVGIKQAGIVIPGDRMPLCLPGIYWIATSESPSEKTIEVAPPRPAESVAKVTDATTTIPIQNAEQFTEAWKDFEKIKNVQEFLIRVKQLLEAMSEMEDDTWKKLCQIITNFNKTQPQPIIFCPNRKITAAQFKEMEASGKFRFKIAHTNRWEEGWMLAQEPELDQCMVLVASGIPSKVIQTIQKLHIWAKAQHYRTDMERIELIRCNFLSFLKHKPQREALRHLLEFYDEYPSESQKSKEDREILKAWLDKEDKE